MGESQSKQASPESQNRTKNRQQPRQQVTVPQAQQYPYTYRNEDVRNKASAPSAPPDPSPTSAPSARLYPTISKNNSEIGREVDHQARENVPRPETHQQTRRYSYTREELRAMSCEPSTRLVDSVKYNETEKRVMDTPLGGLNGTRPENSPQARPYSYTSEDLKTINEQPSTSSTDLLSRKQVLIGKNKATMIPTDYKDNSANGGMKSNLASGNPGSLPNCEPEKCIQSVQCSSCTNQLGIDIYQCTNGHSSCQQCRMQKSHCGTCLQEITNVRNYALEALIAELKSPCPNKKDGCSLKLKTDTMESHLKECPFRNIKCLLDGITGHCAWTGKVQELSGHIHSKHPDNCQGKVDQEMVLPNIMFKDNFIHFVEVENCKFLVTIRVNAFDGNTYMTVQLLGTKITASKWNYELHVYNKSEPRRKYCFQSPCHAIGKPMDEIMQDADCSVIPLPLLATYVNEGAVFYKFFIKNEKINERKQCVGGARRRPRK